VTHDDATQRAAELHQLLGAFILGGLEPEEHRDFTRHLRTCPACQQEAAQFSGLPALLDLAEPAVSDLDLVATAATTEPVASVPVPHLLLEAVRARRRARRWRVAVAAVVLALAAGGLGASIGPVLARVQAAPTSRVVAVPAGSGSASVQIDLVTRAWGTQLDVAGSGLPTSGVLYLWVTNRAGYSYSVASWRGIPSGRTTLSAACWMAAADIRAVDVRTADGATLAAAAT